MSTLVAYLRLMRVHSCVAAVTGALVVAALLNEDPWSSAVVTACLVVFLVTGGGNALNDYHDREIDRINKPSRPLPSGAIPARVALLLAWSLFVAGIVACVPLGPPCVAVAVVNTGLLVAYARSSKRWGIGKNLVVAWLVGSLFLFTALAVGKADVLVVTLGACAFLATLAREIVKDIEDAEADRNGNARTLPLRIGAAPARRIAFAALAASVGLAVVPYTLQLMPTRSLWLIVLGAAVFATGYFRHDAAKSQRLIMAGSLIELCAFWVARQ